MGAIAHLATEADGEPDLTIGIWDTATTGVPLPLMPWPESAIRFRGDIEGVAGQGLRASYRPGTAELSLFDVAGRRALYNTRQASALPHDCKGSPLLSLFSWHAPRLRLTLVHGAAVGDSGRCALLVGAGGAGKSTTALACVRGGLSYLGDDYVLVGLEPEPRTVNLYASAKLVRGESKTFPGLRDLHVESSSAGEKSVFSLAAPDRPSGYGSVVAELPLAAILIPHVTGRTGTTVRPATAREAFSALTPSTVFQVSGSDASQVRFLGRLVRALPCFHLDLGNDLGSIPGVVRDLLGSLRE